jgi:hypothetical protein
LANDLYVLLRHRPPSIPSSSGFGHWNASSARIRTHPRTSTGTRDQATRPPSYLIDVLKLLAPRVLVVVGRTMRVDGASGAARVARCGVLAGGFVGG